MFCDLQSAARQNCKMEFEERLKWARSQRYPEAKLAAEAMGVPPGTYGNHEAGSRRPRPTEIERYAKFFRVPVAWLAFEEGSPANPVNTIRIDGLVGAGGEIDPNLSLAYAGDVAQIELDIPMPAGIRAYEVWGISMLPKYDPGDVVLVRAGAATIDSVLGHVALAVTRDGRRFLKRVLKGSSEGLYNLESFNAPTMVDQELSEVGSIYIVVPASEVRRPVGEKEIARRYARARKPSRAA